MSNLLGSIPDDELRKAITAELAKRRVQEHKVRATTPEESKAKTAWEEARDWLTEPVPSKFLESKFPQMLPSKALAPSTEEQATLDADTSALLHDLENRVDPKLHKELGGGAGRGWYPDPPTPEEEALQEPHWLMDPVEAVAWGTAGYKMAKGAGLEGKALIGEVIDWTAAGGPSLFKTGVKAPLKALARGKAAPRLERLYGDVAKTIVPGGKGYAFKTVPATATKGVPKAARLRALMEAKERVKGRVETAKQARESRKEVVKGAEEVEKFMKDAPKVVGPKTYEEYVAAGKKVTKGEPGGFIEEQVIGTKSYEKMIAEKEKEYLGVGLGKAQPYWDELKGTIGKVIGRYKAALDQPSVLTDVWSEIERHYAASNMAGWEAQKLQTNITKMLPNLEQRRMVTFGLEQPERYGYSLVTEEMKQVAELMRKHWDDLGKLGQETGVITRNLLEDYVPHVYKGNSKKLEELTAYIMARTKGIKSLEPKAFFTFSRKIEFLDKAKKLGLKPVEDIAELAAIYENSFFKSLSNKMLVKTLMEMKNENGLKLIVSSKVAQRSPMRYTDYVRLDLPSLNKFVSVGLTEEGAGMLVKSSVHVDKRLAKDLVDVFGRDISEKWLGNYAKNYKVIRGEIKRWIMLNPLIHGKNILSDVLAEVGLNPYKAVKVMWAGEESGRQLWKRQSKVIDDFVSAGGNMEGLQQFNQGLREGVSSEIAKYSNNPLMKIYGKMADLNDKALWQGIVRNAQIGTFQVRRASIMEKYGPKLMAKHGNKEVVKRIVDRIAAQKINNLYGTLPSIWMDRYTRDLGSMFLFARNWTFSNLNLVANALRTDIPRMKSLKGMTPEMKDILQKEYATHLATGVFALLAEVQLMNYAFSGHSMWENEEGRKLFVDTGRRDVNGRPIYVAPPFFSYIRDILNWSPYGGDPLRVAYNKAEPLLKNVGEQLIDYSVWQSQNITNPGATAPENIWRRVKYFVRGITPLGNIPEEGHHKDWRSYIWLILGTHERKGYALMSESFTSLRKDHQKEFLRSINEEERGSLQYGVGRGVIINEMSKGIHVATKLLHYRQEKKYKTESIDDRIHDKFVDGDIQGAIKIMIDEDRYVKPRSINKRVKRYMEIRK